MVRVNHTQEPFLGTILFNAGGPGLATRSLVAGSGSALLILTGGHYDLIGHDPRGTGDTIPYVCRNETEALISYLGSPRVPEAYDVAAGRIWADKYFLTQSCATRQARYGELVGTAFTARDLMQIVDALGGDRLLRFWGISYGSALGSTVAAMFPNRMARIVIDGTLNMHQYYAGLDYQQVAKVDASFYHFLEACIQGSSRCALAKQGNSADELQAKVYNLFETIKREPLALGPDMTQLVTYDGLKINCVTGLRTPPTSWPILATMLNALFVRNATAYIQASNVFNNYFATSWPDLGAADGVAGIRCSDHSFRTQNLSDLYPVIAEFQNTSRIGGGFLAAAQPMTCARWPFKAKEQIQWKPSYNTSFPLLIIGNTWDPLTPVDSAFNTSVDFPGSRVLHQNTGGHASLSHSSMCTARIIQAYFTNGTLPANGTICEPDQPLAGFANTSATTKKRSLLSARDVRLLDAMDEVRVKLSLRI